MNVRQDNTLQNYAERSLAVDLNVSLRCWLYGAHCHNGATLRDASRA